MLFVIQILAIIAIVSTVLSLMYRKKWWIRVFDFPRLQILGIQSLCILVLLIIIIRNYNWFNSTLLALTFVTFIIQVVYIYPYFPFTKLDVKTAKKESLTVSLIVANVLMTNREGDKLPEIVKEYQPDIVLAVETDEWWNNQLKQLDEYYEYTVKKPLDNTYGMLLFSKLPLENTSVEYIIKEDIPSIHTDVRKDDFVFKLRCLHPEPPAPGEAETSGPRDRELVKMAGIIKDNPAPHIVLGDLNDVAWSDTSYKFERISELKDPRQGRGFFNTFHAKIPVMRWALDHIFVSEEFKVIDLIRLPNIGSDHFPMYFKFSVE